jgi:hypothetical protein
MSKNISDVRVTLADIDQGMQSLGLGQGTRTAILRVISRKAIEAGLRDADHLPTAPLPEVFRPQAG